MLETANVTIVITCKVTIDANARTAAKLAYSAMLTRALQSFNALSFSYWITRRLSSYTHDQEDAMQVCLGIETFISGFNS